MVVLPTLNGISGIFWLLLAAPKILNKQPENE
jgi:hypothetical protein